MTRNTAPLWRRVLFRIGLAPNFELEDLAHELLYAKNDLEWAEGRFQSMQREIDDLKTERAKRKLDEALRQLKEQREHYARLKDIAHQMNCDLMERPDALAQSDVEPVAWQYRWRVHEGHDWTSWHDLPEDCVKRYAEIPDCETRALYTAPPRPDASAELIEAAEIVDQVVAEDEANTTFEPGLRMMAILTAKLSGW